MNLAVLIYTNEHNLPILKLFLKYFFKHNSTFDFPIYVVANKIDKIDLPYQDKITYLSGNIEFNGAGGHFAQTLINTLPQIKEEYIFYFCEDYLLTHPIDQNALSVLIQMMQYENIDLFSFASMYPINHGFTEFTQQHFTIPYFDIPLYNIGIEYRHAYSVQPCIWKKQSLIQILNDNPTVSLHDMDNSILNNKDKYKIICTNLKIYDQSYQPDYFIIGYKEIIRYGVFLLTLNGQIMEDTNHAEVFMRKVIKENNLHNNSEYDRYILFDKNIINTW